MSCCILSAFEFMSREKDLTELLESVYEIVLAYELKKKDMTVKQRTPVTIEKVNPVHKKQLLTYLKLADKKLCLLINFGA